MAKTIKIAKFVKPPRADDRTLAERRSSKPGLYLLELRSHAAALHSPLPKRKLVITVDSNGGELGHPKAVKITHT
jgi:hypothetical protein